MMACTTPERSVESAINQIFLAHDIDRDGCLSRAEWAAMAAIARDALASDRPDNLNQTEQSYLEAFSELDRNGDECLTEEEYRVSAQATRRP